NALVSRRRHFTTTRPVMDVEMPSRYWQRVRLQLSTRGAITSPVVQDAIRAGIGLGIAVFIADSLALDHAFWVVLGTLSVLRSNAFATGATALSAALGTAIGFGATAVLLGLVGDQRAVLWIFVVLGLFFAAYLPDTHGFLAGQIAFTV